jgi:hypothetical protein
MKNAYFFDDDQEKQQDVVYLKTKSLDQIYMSDLIWYLLKRQRQSPLS